MVERERHIPITQEMQSSIFTELTVNQNVESFIEGKNDKLFITGMIGSGKTTLAGILSRRWGISDTRHVDEIGEVLDKSDPGYEEKYSLMLEQLIYEPGRAIIEGVGLLKLPLEFFSERSVIVPDVTITEASKRASARDEETEEELQLRTIMTNRKKWEQAHVQLVNFLRGGHGF